MTVEIESSDSVNRRMEARKVARSCFDAVGIQVADHLPHLFLEGNVADAKQTRVLVDVMAPDGVVLYRGMFHFNL